MRICMVSETWAPDINGVAHTLNHLSKELERRGVEQQLIRPRPRKAGSVPSMRDELQVKGYRLPRYTDVQFGHPARRAIVRFWQEQRPDAVYIATEGPLGFAALGAAHRLAIPVVSGLHTNFDQYAVDYGVRWLRAPVTALLRHFHNRTQATLVPTMAQAESLRSVGYRNVHVMGRGIDSTHFHPDQRDVDLRKSWGIEEHQPAVLHVGRLASEKNLDLLARTFQAMRDVRPDLALVLVGDGPQRDMLQRRLPDAIFTGFIDHHALARHYASADLFIFPSLSETYGNVVGEAMASGLGVLAFDYAAASELIENQLNGILVERGDEAGFIDAAVGLCQQPARYAQLGRAARTRIRTQSWERIADIFLTTLTRVKESLHGVSPASYRH